MDIPKIFTIICPACGSTFREEGTVLGDGWLVTCLNCSQQSILTDEAILEAKRAGHKTITGKPLGSSGADTPAQKTNPVVRNAELRAGKTQVENPLIHNAERRAKTQKTEVHSNV